MSADTDVVSLWGECGEFSMPERTWRHALALASAHGWSAQGTLPGDSRYVDRRDIAAWDGGYTPPVCQRMLEDDCRAMAAALERALADVPDHDALDTKRAEAPPDPPAPWAGPGTPGIAITAPEEFSGPHKQWLRHLITHLRDCGEIWIC